MREDSNKFERAKRSCPRSPRISVQESTGSGPFSRPSERGQDQDRDRHALSTMHPEVREELRRVQIDLAVALVLHRGMRALGAGREGLPFASHRRAQRSSEGSRSA